MVRTTFGPLPTQKIRKLDYNKSLENEKRAAVSFKGENEDSFRARGGQNLSPRDMAQSTIFKQVNNKELNNLLLALFRIREKIQKGQPLPTPAFICEQDPNKNVSRQKNNIALLLKMVYPAKNYPDATLEQVARNPDQAGKILSAVASLYQDGSLTSPMVLENELRKEEGHSSKEKRLLEKPLARMTATALAATLLLGGVGTVATRMISGRGDEIAQPQPTTELPTSAPQTQAAPTTFEPSPIPTTPDGTIFNQTTTQTINNKSSSNFALNPHQPRLYTIHEMATSEVDSRADVPDVAGTNPADFIGPEVGTRVRNKRYIEIMENLAVIQKVPAVNSRLGEILDNPQIAATIPELQQDPNLLNSVNYVVENKEIYELLRDDRLKLVIDAFKEHPEWAQGILDATNKFNLEEHAIEMIAQIQQESMFNPTIIAGHYKEEVEQCQAGGMSLDQCLLSVNADKGGVPMGLAQMKPTTASGLNDNYFTNPSSPYYDPNDAHPRVTSNPNDAIELLIAYDAQNYQRFNGDLMKMHAAYNSGGGAVERANGLIPRDQSRIYINLINDVSAHIRNQYPNILEDAVNGTLNYDAIDYIELYDQQS